MSTFPLTCRESVAFKAINVIAYVLFASSNTYAAITGKHIAGNVDTYITPAAWFYGIWHILNVLFLGLIVYQFWPGTAQLTQYSLGWRFPTALVLHALCTLLYTQKNSTPIYCVAFITFCMVTTLVNQLYGILRTNAEPLNWADVFFVFLPISLYHGATILLFFVSVFAISGFHSTEHEAGMVTKVLVFLILFFLDSTVTGYVFYGNGDIGGASVISIGLLAIAQHQQTSRFIHWSALCVFLSMLTILQSVFCDFIYRSDSGYYSHDPRPAKHTSSWYERRKCSASPIITFCAHSTIYSI